MTVIALLEKPCAVRAVTRTLKHLAKEHLSLASVTDALVGVVTFVQWCDSSLRLNPHFHSLALDGVYVRDPTGTLVFHALAAPTQEEVQQVAAWTHAGIERALRARSRSLDEGAGDAHGIAEEQPVLASVYAASAADLQLLGDAAGQRTLKLVQTVRAVRPAERALAEVGGVNIHAEVVVDGRDRARLERVLRYMARPPLATERLELRDDGYVVYRFKKAWKDRTSAVVLSPEEFIARLCALVPPPRFQMTRYHGVLSSHASVRAEIVPKKPPALPVQLPLFGKNDEPLPPVGKTAEPSRHPWAWLLRRVFAVEILECIRCGGALRIMKIATTPDEIARALGEQPRPRGPPFAELAVTVYGQLRLRFA